MPKLGGTPPRWFFSVAACDLLLERPVATAWRGGAGLSSVGKTLAKPHERHNEQIPNGRNGVRMADARPDVPVPRLALMTHRRDDPRRSQPRPVKDS